MLIVPAATVARITSTAVPALPVTRVEAGALYWMVLVTVPPVAARESATVAPASRKSGSSGVAVEPPPIV